MNFILYRAFFNKIRISTRKILIKKKKIERSYLVPTAVSIFNFIDYLDIGKIILRRIFIEMPSRIKRA